MTDLFAELARALRERLTIIADQESRRSPEEHMKRLKFASEQIADAAGKLPADVDSHLRHYLARCSYDKALAFIEQQETHELGG